MVKAIIIAAVLFTIGNVAYSLLKEYNILYEPKIFYVPLAMLLLCYQWYVMRTQPKASRITQYFLIYILLLGAGNLMKQVFYTEKIKQINDYYWGGLLTVGLITMIIWETLKRRSGKK